MARERTLERAKAIYAYAAMRWNRERWSACGGDWQEFDRLTRLDVSGERECWSYRHLMAAIDGLYAARR